jgi:hypothetical protein
MHDRACRGVNLLLKQKLVPVTQFGCSRTLKLSRSRKPSRFWLCAALMLDPRSTGKSDNPAILKLKFKKKSVKGHIDGE